MLAYQIMAAADPVHVGRLLRWMHRPNATYVVSVDATADVDAFRAALPGHDNVKLLAEIPITWGGITQVLSLLRAIDSCLRASTHWRWFINVSDSDVPLRSQEAIVGRLEAENARGFRDFVGRSMLRLRAPWFEPFKAAIAQPSEVALAEVRPDITFRIHPQLRRWFTTKEASPIYNTLLRVALHTTDLPAEKTLSLRPLYPFEVRLRQNFYQSFEPVFGKPWVILSRQTCQWLLDWHRLPELLGMFAHTFCPDESVLHTALYHRGFPGFEWLHGDNLRWAAGRADYVKDEILADLKASDRLFARKVRLDASDELLAWIDAGPGAPLSR